MRGNIIFWSAILITCASSCGGSQEPAKSPDSPSAGDESTVQPPVEPKPEKKDDDVDKPEGGEGDKPDGAGAVKEPEFKEGMSVDEAIDAVPQGTPRVNVDQEALGRPLMDSGLFKPCALSPAQHFRVKVAVWEGKAVGIDVVATPKNDKAVSCIKDRIKTITWKDKVKSLNTVEYQF